MPGYWGKRWIFPGCGDKEFCACGAASPAGSPCRGRDFPIAGKVTKGAPKETYSEAVSFGILPRRPREEPCGVPPLDSSSGDGDAGGEPRLREAVSGAGIQISTLKNYCALPAAPSETAYSRPAPACLSSNLCPLRVSARRTGVQGDAPAALFPRFLPRRRNRAAGGKPSGERNTSPARRPVRMDHTRDNCISVRCVPSSGAPRQLPPREARVLAAPASGFFQRGPSSPVPAERTAFPGGKVAPASHGSRRRMRDSRPAERTASPRGSQEPGR